METIKGQHFSKKSFKNMKFENINYDDCIFYQCSFVNTQWINCRFKNTSIVGKSKLDRCEFNNCNFSGQHTNLGGPTKYINCKFLDSDFKNIQFWNTIFKDCIFTGRAENIVFYGKDSPKGWETVFDNVDLLKLERELVDFRCKFDLSKTLIIN
jgi:uncharacterized protein YjbI with pentapeptide repeats